MIDDSVWVDLDLPLELEFKCERVVRLVDELSTEELQMVCRATMVHNFHLMNEVKKLRAEKENERPNRKTRKAPSKSGKV